MKRQIFVILGILLGILSLAVTAKADDVFKKIVESETVCQDTTIVPLGYDFVFGSDKLDYSGTDTAIKASRFFFDKSKGAFRVGICSTANWNSGNIGDYSFAEGSNTTASREGSHAEGLGTTASGQYSHAEGSATTAANSSSHAEGSETQALAVFSHAEGYMTEVSGDYGGTGHAEGNRTKVTGNGGHAEGYSTRAESSHSHAEGMDSRAYLYSQHAKASGSFTYPGDAGDAQYSQLIERGETTTADTAVLYLNGINYNAVLPDTTTWVFQIFVVARQTAGSGIIGDSAGYKIEGVIKRDNANNTILVGPVVKTIIAEDRTAWDATVVADNTNEALVVQVNGEAGKTIRWVATINLTEVGG